MDVLITDWILVIVPHIMVNEQPQLFNKQKGLTIQSGVNKRSTERRGDTVPPDAR